ncbi:MAG: hypothetical protein AB1582_12170 [Pseudomonadota bacterium]
MAERGTIQKIADVCGADHQSVRRALDRAGIAIDSENFNFDDAVAAVREIADPARLVGHAATRVTESGGSAMREARIRSEELKARRLEIENQKAEGALVSREAVTDTGARIIAEARTALLSLGYRLAEKVAGKSDTREIARIVESEVRDVLGALADEDRFFAALEAEALA